MAASGKNQRTIVDELLECHKAMKSHPVLSYRGLSLAACAILMLGGCDSPPPATSAADDSPARPEPGRMVESGAEVPNFQLTDHTGRTIALRDLRPRATLVTFIFTRCSAAEFCPTMARKFSETRAALDASPLGSQVTLLSVTLDPAHDTPEVLAGYAGHVGAKPESWLFATPGVAGLEEIKKAFGVTSAYSEETGTIEHNLVTALIDRDGRLHRIWPGNRWETTAILAEIPAATGTEIADRGRSGS